MIGSCQTVNSSLKASFVKTVINPDNKGWYLIAIINDSTIQEKEDVVVDFKNQDETKKISLTHYSKYDYKIFDLSGKDVTTSMKLTGFLFYKNSSVIFHFYNPSERELKEVSDWQPLTKHVDSLMRLSRDLIRKKF